MAVHLVQPLKAVPPVLRPIPPQWDSAKAFLHAVRPTRFTDPSDWAVGVHLFATPVVWTGPGPMALADQTPRPADLQRAPEGVHVWFHSEACRAQHEGIVELLRHWLDKDDGICISCGSADQVYRRDAKPQPLWWVGAFLFGLSLEMFVRWIW